MQINVGDIFKFPNGKYQYKIDKWFIKQYLGNCYIKNIYITSSNPFFKEQNRIYNESTGEWRLNHERKN